MAGFRDFQTGEVLTAANVNDFLAKQSVMKFADATARDTALGTAVGGGNALREGMVAYLDDEDLPSFYNGTSWTTKFGGGGLVAVKSALFTGTQTNSTASGADFAITDLTITHEVADASNKLVLMATCGVLASSVGTLESGIAFHDGTSLIGIGTADGNRTSVSTGGLGKESGAGNGISGAPHAFTLVHTPGTGSKTYTVRAFNSFTSTQTIYVNRTPTDTDNVRFVRGASSFVLMEVKV